MTNITKGLGIMRIVSWNCCMAYRRKHHLIDLLQPDISTIQEISQADVDIVDAPFRFWVGKNSAKGMAVLGYGNNNIEVATDYAAHLPWFVPLIVDDIHILAIWASTTDSRARRYVRLVHEALDHYQAFLSDPKTVLIGDFNSNAIFDSEHRQASHSHLVERLNEVGISSVYHAQTGDVQGAEHMPTFFLHRSLEKPFHLDFAFVSESLLGNAKLAIGTPDKYLGPSDHLPLILEIRT